MNIYIFSVLLFNSVNYITPKTKALWGPIIFSSLKRSLGQKVWKAFNYITSLLLLKTHYLQSKSNFLNRIFQRTLPNLDIIFTRIISHKIPLWYSHIVGSRCIYVMCYTMIYFYISSNSVISSLLNPLPISYLGLLKSYSSIKINTNCPCPASFSWHPPGKPNKPWEN